jgi:transglutaminase-like putative cysteine protease
MVTLPARRALAALCLCLAPALLAGEARAQDPLHLVDLQTLAQGIASDAVVRLDETTLEVKGPGRATQRRRLVVTVFNEEGRDAATMVVGYDRIRRLDGVKGALYDAEGDRIRKLGKDDQMDLSAISGISLYEDNRVRALTLRHDQYPYTVEFETEVDHRGLLNWPRWFPQRMPYPVQRARLTVEAPTDIGMRYLVQNFPEAMPGEPVRETDGRTETLRWDLADLEQPDYEPRSPQWADRSPVVFLAATDFEVEGHQGQMDTWEALGTWYYTLAEGRQGLPEAEWEAAQAAMEGATTQREKAERLYHFMQSRTRYVSVQLGIGGWQPFDATYVTERGYGDCKALTNYMQALLEAAGIQAYPALIYSNPYRRPVRPEFPMSTFNHVILMVPLQEAAADGTAEGTVQRDTLWLESTSQTIPFGYIGSGNEDKLALIAKPSGSHLVRTPSTTASGNLQARSVALTLAATGDAEVDVTTRYTGNQQERMRGASLRATPRERAERLRNSLDMGSFEVVSADYSQIEAGGSSVALPISLRAPRYASRVGKRLFVPLMPLDRWSYVPEADTLRTQPVLVSGYRYLDTDSVTIALPEGFRVEAFPAPTVVEAPFGAYRAEAKLSEDGSAVIYTRHLEVDRPRLGPEDFDAYRAALSSMSRADDARLVLVKE